MLGRNCRMIIIMNDQYDEWSDLGLNEIVEE